LDQNFVEELQSVGPVIRQELATPDQIAFAEKHVSQTYSQFIAQHGYGTVCEGRFQFCPIDRFRPLAALIFKADPDFSHTDCHIVGFDAFGMRVQAWSEKHYSVAIDLLEYKVSNIALAPSILNYMPPLPDTPRAPRNRETMTRMILPHEREAGDMWDWQDEPMYARCAEAYGALEFGECYGFFPSLGMVGFQSRFRAVENIKRVKALEHFCMIAQMQDFNLVRYNMGRDEIVRPIG
jgi:hypothetical protein